ncbi:sigma-B regulation protein RsbQ [Mucilaginibacter pineti]|uniref:Sigma-B regulation protein RsbQ n=1 Tax=Mucilaginibacter pineti TaxID=1391627 RepID=A0A1G7C7Y4_9SPHI|nr:alpha/beta hydrolase [Mucilaginibacter pineti]SDE35427.1 sigma-B regulation protein RsbQ [Mucilaginibacter pineti]
MNDILKRNNVQLMGEGEQYMIFAHGYGCDQHVWSDMVPAFVDDYKLVLFDYVGSGESDLSAYDAKRYSSLNGYAQDLIEICDALQIRNAILVGHSVSSMIGVLAANQRPEFFSKLIFLGPSPCYLNKGDYHGGFEQADLDGLFEMMDNNYLGWAQALAPQIMANGDRPELGETLTTSFCATDPVIAQQFARVTFLSDNREDLAKLKLPSLTLQCSSDIIAPLEVGKYIHNVLPDNRLVVLKATGHCSHMSAPAETIAAIRNFI